jgi:hypothetical protein
MADRLWDYNSRHGIDRCVLDSGMPDSGGQGYRSSVGEPEVCEECKWPQDRRVGLSMVANAALLRIITSFVSTGAGDRDSAQLVKTPSDVSNMPLRISNTCKKP